MTTTATAATRAGNSPLLDLISRRLDAANGFDTNGLCLLIVGTSVFAYEAVGVALPDYRRYRKNRQTVGLSLICYVDADAWAVLAEELPAKGYTVRDGRG